MSKRHLHLRLHPLEPPHARIDQQDRTAWSPTPSNARLHPGITQRGTTESVPFHPPTHTRYDIRILLVPKLARRPTTYTWTAAVEEVGEVDRSGSCRDSCCSCGGGCVWRVGGERGRGSGEERRVVVHLSHPILSLRRLRPRRRFLLLLLRSRSWGFPIDQSSIR
ncbi:hypothetical protein BT69DRAFT_1005507 [Atractiella rhizophila]|nr:hypothetical protein BT69DRAFT_1005507 [Atractiella rhizophila]